MNSSVRLQVSIDEQTLRVFDASGLIRSYPVSTAARGMGCREGSLRTPTGRLRIARKIGAGQPCGTIFRSREPVGCWDGEPASAEDLILTRILWLEGLDEENANTLGRYIYIHGTHREDLLGTPASHGCVRMANQDLLELFERVEEGTPVEILPATRRRGKLLFLDCDSTLSTIEGIDELARARGEEVFQRVVALTDAAMNGEVAIAEVFPRRMELIRPDRKLCDRIAQRYIECKVEGVEELLSEVKQRGWTPVILSGGFAPLIEPLAALLGIQHIEAVPIHFDADGGYAGFGGDFPTTRNHGKNEVIREWKAALLPECVAMMGDGVSDLETRTDVDLFIGFGGVVERSKVKAGAGFWLNDMRHREGLWQALDGLAGR
ncbi:MAG TPA: HAD-IB family phosphatase [Luteolibacter sp.]|nr:HAD-IB family phosphatase [Luteolibacter sp.]